MTHVTGNALTPPTTRTNPAGLDATPATPGRPPAPFGYVDKGKAAFGRGTAVVQLRRGRTLKGKAAMLTRGQVQQALLPSGEDRIKSLVGWIWAGFTHERVARITVTEATGRERAAIAAPPAAGVPPAAGGT
jgi:hypothetical protein